MYLHSTGFCREVLDLYDRLGAEVEGSRQALKEACVCLSIHADTHELEAGTLPGLSGWPQPRPVLARVESLIRV